MVGANLAIWQTQNLVLPVATGVALLFVMYLFSVTYALFVETRGKRQLAGLFGQYVPPELVDEMSDDPESFSLEGESREPDRAVLRCAKLYDYFGGFGSKGAVATHE